jgi:preprotein translocase subunit SecE
LPHIYNKAAGFFNLHNFVLAKDPITTMKPFFDYLSASRAELAKVSWPNRRQTARLTMVVIAFALVFAAVLGTIDLGFSALLQKVIVKG